MIPLESVLDETVKSHWKITVPVRSQKSNSESLVSTGREPRVLLCMAQTGARSAHMVVSAASTYGPRVKTNHGAGFVCWWCVVSGLYSQGWEDGDRIVALPIALTAPSLSMETVVSGPSTYIHIVSIKNVWSYY